MRNKILKEYNKLSSLLNQNLSTLKKLNIMISLVDGSNKEFCPKKELVCRGLKLYLRIKRRKLIELKKAFEI